MQEFERTSERRRYKDAVHRRDVDRADGKYAGLGSAVAERHVNILTSKEHNVIMGTCHKKVQTFTVQVGEQVPSSDAANDLARTNGTAAIDAEFSGRGG
jgi:hypothetical protein